MPLPERRQPLIDLTPELTHGLNIPDGQVVEWLGEPNQMITLATEPEGRVQSEARRNANAQSLATCMAIIELDVSNKKKSHFEIPVGIVFSDNRSLRRVSLILDRTVSKHSDERQKKHYYAQITQKSGLQLSLVIGGFTRSKDPNRMSKKLGSLVDLDDPETAIVYGPDYDHKNNKGTLELIGSDDPRLLGMLGLLSLAEGFVATKYDEPRYYLG
ncbi:hypothetical protein H7171_04610 [Candidatus Saccharibacteria bacterium]|nr:hypothetical protein [Candidatus Saccharibacteria bacterium]